MSDVKGKPMRGTVLVNGCSRSVWDGYGDYDLTHGNFWNKTYEIYAFFRHVLYGENTLTQFGDIVVVNGKATLQTENDLYHSVNFLYTTSTDADSHQWEWRTLPVTKADGVYSCAIPENATAYLFEMIGDSNSKDKDKNFRQSTPVYFTVNNQGQNL
jgi:hypothetical protein